MTGPALEATLRRNRRIVLGGIVAITLIAWIYLMTGAGMGMSVWEMTVASVFPHTIGGTPGHDAGAITGMSAATAGSAVLEAGHWTLDYTAMMLAMWWMMMIAMMTPSAAPMILLHARVARRARSRGQAAGPIGTGHFTAGYLIAWLGFSVAATALHWGLERAGWLSPMMMGANTAWLSAGVLTAAALYQLSPLKSACLAHCRAPAEYLARHWRAGRGGAFRMGLGHGAFCVGCCWGLMALLFVGGVMNILWIAALTLFVLAEKLMPRGERVGQAGAAVLLVWAGATLAV